MKKKLIVLLILGFMTTAFAEERTPGYLYTFYGDLVRDAYGGCIHSAYYSPEDGLAECGEAPQVNSDE
ncbi:MAG: hypothetical protein KBD37_04450 [Burkholderiales bacterium]|nr:hypothetical protein [Burkholderiales bacterium]